MENELLVAFGKALLSEMLQIFVADSNVVIPFTEESLKDVCLIYNFDYNEISSAFKKVWSRGCDINNPYLLLSCCTFQVMISYKCLASDLSAYNQVFCSFIKEDGFKFFGEECLQDIYKEDFRGKRRQDLIWDEVKKLLLRNGLRLCIPKPTTYKGCFIQYPLSQRIIDRTTLEKYIKKAKTILDLKSYDTCSLDEFSRKLFNEPIPLSPNTFSSVMKKTDMERVAKRIVFYCYCNWIDHISKSKKRLNQEKTYIVRIIDGSKFDLMQSDGTKSKDIQSVCFKPFLYDEVYNQWIFSDKKVDASQKKLLGVILDSSKWKKYEFLEKSVYYKFNGLSDYRFYSALPSEFFDLDCKKWFREENISFVGGIKDNDGNWLLGILPLVTVKCGQNSLLINQNKFDFNHGVLDLNKAITKEGMYRLKLLDSLPIYINVVQPSKSSQKNKGWKWENQKADFRETSEDFILSGLFVDLSQINKSNKHWGNIKIEDLDDKYNKIGVTSKINEER